MNAHPVLEGNLTWLLNHSLQAGVLVLLVLAVQGLFRRRLAGRWRFALWWIVLARLLLPFSLPSAVSLFNFFQPTVQLEGPRYYAPVTSTAMTERIPSRISPLIVLPAQNEPSQVENQPVVPPPARADNLPAPVQSASAAARSKHSLSFDDFLIPGLAGLWLAGVLILSGVVVAQLVRFYRKLARAAAPADANLKKMLDDCRHEFGLSQRVELWETDAVQSPALFGLWRLRLLVPRGFGGQCARRELRYIFLHELAHVKRGDLWLNWLVTALQILHWFNPLLWLGFARLRADRELACDELALLRAGDNVGTAYGETVVKLLENLSQPAAIPGLIGILEDKKQMRRRIAMIASFRRPGRWSALAVVLIAVVATAALTDAQPNKPADPRIKVENDAANLSATNAKSANSQYDPYFVRENNLSGKLPTVPVAAAQFHPDLTGQVSIKGGGTLPVPATVFIATAAPKTGTSTFCPSCYADCVKHTRAEAQGNFKIEALDPQLTFQVLAVAKGYQPKSVSKVDPTNGPVKIELEPIESADAAPDRSLRGRVADAKGQPIEGAVVDMQGIETKDGGGSWGALAGIDPLAVTDTNGEFLITAKKPFDMMDVRVSARTFADKNFSRLPAGKPNELVMTEGAAVTGRVVADGRPVSGVSIGISGVERRSGVYAGHYEIGTDAEGRFVLVNIPPDIDFWIYGNMNSLKSHGAIPLQKFRSRTDGETTKFGDLSVAPAHRLAGRVVLSDGQPLPSKVRLLVSREDAWDSMQITLDANGSFDTTGIPNELVNLSARVKGYHVSARNLSVDQLNPYRLIGRVDRDITNLLFVLEKGPDPQPDYHNVDPEYHLIRERTLRGAEGVVDHAREWLISGRVLDSDTKQPVQNFRVTPGQTDNFNHTAWSTLRAVDGSNGVYLTYISKRTAQPLLLAESEGYLPAGIELLPRDATNVDFVLKHGSGPAGTVVLSDGKPAAGATVVLLKDEMNQAGLNSAGVLNAYANRSAAQQTDASGHFSLKPIWGAKSLAAASSNGFAIVSVETLATNPVITLAPLGKISGTLKRASGPGTNEILDLRFADAGLAGLSRINLQITSTTDAQGRFAFDGVPPGHLHITYRDMMPDGHGWSTPSLQEVELKPGAALDVNISAPDRPAKSDKAGWLPPLPPKPIPGEQVKGVVLLPNGKPAADAEVALQVENEYLAIGKGAFSASGAREKGMIVNAGPDGSFKFPLYEQAQSVIALNEEGYAQVSLEQLKASSQIQLQKWGRIEGTLRVGHHLGTNETVGVSGAMPRWTKKTIRRVGQTNNVIEFTNAAPAILPTPIYDSNAFQARTDAQGRFVMTFVPPGEQRLWRQIPAGENSWTQSQLADVVVKPGATIVTNIGGTGRMVIGKATFTGDSTVTFKNGMGVITTPTFKIFEKARQLKTDAERAAFYQSPEVEAATSNQRGFSVRVEADGTFRAEDVLPGTYEFDFQPTFQLDETNRAWVTFVSAQEFTVPAAKDEHDDSAVELGNIELKKRVLPKPDVGQP